jgi:hypothetical protein
MQPIKEIKPFTIKLNVGGNNYWLKIQQEYVSEQIERFKISGLKHNYIMLQSNRPYLRLKGLKRKKIDWKLIEGTVHNTSALEMLLKEMTDHIYGLENPAPEWKDLPKNS